LSKFEILVFLEKSRKIVLKDTWRKKNVFLILSKQKVFFTFRRGCKNWESNCALWGTKYVLWLTNSAFVFHSCYTDFLSVCTLLHVLKKVGKFQKKLKKIKLCCTYMRGRRRQSNFFPSDFLVFKKGYFWRNNFVHIFALV